MILIDPQLKTELALAAQKLPNARLLNRFLTEAQSVVRLKGEVNVLLTTDQNQRSLNRQFRRKNKTTDVLSFPTDPQFTTAKIAGDISISLPVARSQSQDHHHPLITELKVLILHGLLHLAGYDHEADNGQMAKRELTLRAKLSLPSGLIERVEIKKKISHTNKAGSKTA
jgi:probable rRNA maturation factor